MPAAGRSGERARGEETELLKREIAKLQKELAAKSDLIKEVNHRAKNNLQMAMAMLSLQAVASDNPTVSEALNAASERLGYLARVHELLYQRGDDIQAIDVSVFLRDIGHALERAFNRPEVTLAYDVPLLVLDVSRAINVALIVGEAVLNSYKYAFPGTRNGVIEITCKQQGGAVQLAVNDDGVGFSVEQRRGSLGMRLLRALGRTLGGETVVNGDRGTRVEVSFPLWSADRS